ncbi:MAG: 30S ribosomal protein S16 [Candidatus Sungbacteria bacterium]|nr:30S ribosomal protein S16 [bacterium]MDZ4260375.1 30S ribosomal protein S16 [Candidatus Sungbacteria bacterium]
MLVIRMQRIGRRNDPAFRVVLTEKRSKPTSGQQEILGSYHPKTKETVLKNERILYWISKGAQASDTVYNLLISKGVMQGKKRNAVRAPVVKETVGEKVKESVAA